MQTDEDAFPFGEEEETPPDASQDSGPMKQLRRHANKLEKDLKAAQADNEELRAFRDDFNNKQKTEKVKAVFEKLELNPTFSRFWQLENPEAEPEEATVAKWAVDNGFAQATEEPTTDVATGFTPTTTPEGTPPGAKRLTRAEWLELSARDPAAGQVAFQKGRVDLSDVRQGLGPEK